VEWTNSRVCCWLQPIVDGAFSPDGQHLATASLDGFVMFYEILQDEEPRYHCQVMLMLAVILVECCIIKHLGCCSVASFHLCLFSACDVHALWLSAQLVFIILHFNAKNVMKFLAVYPVK